jgi:DNA-binding MarR family transcriptional regulator
MQDKEKRIYLYDHILINSNIGSTEKLILFKLYLLDNSERGCYASDKWLSKRIGLKVETINKNLRQLEDKGFIQRSNVYTDHGKHRMIKVNDNKIMRETKIESDNTTYQKQQVPIVENDNAYTKDNTKEKTKEERESSLAFDFLKNNYNDRYENDFKKKYSAKFKSDKERKKFTNLFNNKMVIDKVEFTPDILFARLDTFAIHWIDNASKFNNNEDTPRNYSKIFHGNKKGE